MYIYTYNYINIHNYMIYNNTYLRHYSNSSIMLELILISIVHTVHYSLRQVWSLGTKEQKPKKTVNPNKTLKPSPKPTQIPTLKPTQKPTQKNVKTRTTQCPHTMVVLILATRIILQFLIQFKFYIQGINYAI